jgi:hypothetical protein
VRTPRIEWRPLHGIAGYRAAGLIAILAMLALSTLPLGGGGPSLPYGDKLQHALAYLLMTSWFAQLVDGDDSRSWLASGLFGLGIGVEAVQSLLPWRSAEVADLIANASGIALGLLLTRGQGGRLLERLDARRG